MWVLQTCAAGDEPIMFRVPSGSSRTMGRAPDADLVLDLALISRLHCRLEAGAESLEVVDLSSTNGTFVNDARIERATLKTGDRLRVGRIELKVERAASLAAPRET